MKPPYVRLTAAFVAFHYEIYRPSIRLKSNPCLVKVGGLLGVGAALLASVAAVPIVGTSDHPMTLALENT